MLQPINKQQKKIFLKGAQKDNHKTEEDTCKIQNQKKFIENWESDSEQFTKCFIGHQGNAT